MKFGIKKCVLHIIKSEKRETVKGIELSNQESIRPLGEKENYKYLGILAADVIKRTEMKKN